MSTPELRQRQALALLARDELWQQRQHLWDAAGQYLVLGAKARAALHGHEVVRMADLAAVAPLVLGHRVLLNFQAEAEGQTAPALVATLAGAALT